MVGVGECEEGTGDSGRGEAVEEGRQWGREDKKGGDSEGRETVGEGGSWGGEAVGEGGQSERGYVVERGGEVGGRGGRKTGECCFGSMMICGGQSHLGLQGSTPSPFSLPPIEVNVFLRVCPHTSSA